MLHFEQSVLESIDFGNLPEPVFEDVFGAVNVSVYCAKRFDSSWLNDSLYSIVLQSRRSYLRYGEVPLEDVFDGQSSVYLARAVYSEVGESGRRQEWLCLRFTPSRGSGDTPTDDMRVCSYEGRPIYELIDESLFSGEGNALDHIITLSRLCRILPFSYSEGRHYISAYSEPRLQHTALLFCLICHTVIMSMSDERKENVRYYTALLHDSLIKNRLSLKTPEGGEEGIRFAYAHDVLNIGVDEIKFQRDLLAYRYPLYHLSVNDLFETLAACIDEGLISEQSFKHYLGVNITSEKLLAYVSEDIDYFLPMRNIGVMLTVDGKLHKSRITGQQLRDRLAQEVADAPRLRLMRAESFVEDIVNFIDKLKIFYSNRV